MGDRRSIVLKVWKSPRHMSSGTSAVICLDSFFKIQAVDNNNKKKKKKKKKKTHIPTALSEASFCSRG
jgi:hypothetical protein